MFLPHFLVVFYSYHTAAAVMIPQVDRTLQQFAVATLEAHFSAASSIPMAIRQNSVSDEHNAMDKQDANTFVITADSRQLPQDRYREYRLQKDLMACNA
ncbi:hypothetical protein G6011_08538 [Alternaria panax]|uniref:Secreted protein n=1 Tax=Alternaria panax TaxID=48097 RepID=A0AAD4FI76_9PLEO|nr:hypothetical protein G6011_08538 [Alternaria panax]